MLKQALSSRKDQISIEPSGGNRYISLNTTVKPLDNVNVRRAISAVDRPDGAAPDARRPDARHDRHALPPARTSPGFEEAGGEKGPGFDFTSSPTANVPLAKEYMKKAGYENGKYDGPPLLTIADNESPAKETAEAFQSQVAKIGLKLQLPRGAARDAAVEVLPGAEGEGRRSARPSGWGADFFAAQSFIDPLFNGKNIVPSGNVNTAQVERPEAERARSTRPSRSPTRRRRAKAWAELDKEVTTRPTSSRGCGTTTSASRSTNVNGVSSKFNSGAWDFAFSSLK